MPPETSATAQPANSAGNHADVAPDWSVATIDAVACPLCEYNLRGLVEPRCPECGYRFSWSEVLSPDRRKHPFLFEHHPRHNLWSFARTVLAGAKPWQFWKSLKPTMPSSPRRLVLYWLMSAPLVTVLLISGFVGFARTNAAQVLLMRRLNARWLATTPQDPRLQAVIARYGSVQKYLDATMPRPWTIQFLTRSWQQFWRGGLGMASARLIPSMFAIVGWPWLTFAALMVFQVSMRRAQVRPIHVLRCALYSSDAALLAGLLAGFFMPEPFVASRWSFVNVMGLLIPGTSANFLITGGIVGAVTLYKLGFAYEHYLRMHRAWIVAIASQVLVILAVVTAAQVWRDYFAY